MFRIRRYVVIIILAVFFAPSSGIPLIQVLAQSDTEVEGSFSVPAPEIYGARVVDFSYTLFPASAHTFRRTFASNLHRQGLDVEHIMRLGGWESLDMVVRYTRSVKFEESLKLYQQLK